ncbi:MAG: hypothetical protein ACRCZ2_05240 [Fusobacteriaceae bacterium]
MNKIQLYIDQVDLSILALVNLNSTNNQISVAINRAKNTVSERLQKLENQNLVIKTTDGFRVTTKGKRQLTICLQKINTYLYSLQVANLEL